MAGSSKPEDARRARRGRRLGRKPIIGLSGGIGSGKSAVAACLRACGAGVIDSDVLNHAVLAEPEVAETLRKWFGDRVLSADGSIDRQQVAEVIFGEAAERERVQAYLHPRIGQRRKELAAQYQADPDIRAIVLDSPLLYEVGLDSECDCVIFVDADDATRYDRMAASRGWTVEEVRLRENVQKGLDFKRRRADYIIRNNSSIDALRRQVDEVFSQILTSVSEF